VPSGAGRPELSQLRMSWQRPRVRVYLSIRRQQLEARVCGMHGSST
jgi:hypothetical protein